MTDRRRLDRAGAANVARRVAIAYAVTVLACLLFVGWVFAVVLFDSLGVSAWVLLAVLVGVVAAFGWLAGRAAGLIRVAVALATGAVWVLCVDLSGDSRAMMIAAGAAWVIGVAYVPNLAVRRYERMVGERAARPA